MQRLDPPFRISLHSRRHRLVDIDNLSAKAVIDALVLAHVLVDDTPSFVKEIVQSQEKIPTKELETVTITIESLSYSDGK